MLQNIQSFKKVSRKNTYASLKATARSTELSVLPISRFAALVGHGDNLNLKLVISIQYGKWKTVHEKAANALGIKRPGFRRSLNCSNGAINLIYKLISQSRRMVFIPQTRLFQFLVGFRMYLKQPRAHCPSIGLRLVPKECRQLRLYQFARFFAELPVARQSLPPNLSPDPDL